MLEYLLHTEHIPGQSLHKACEAIVDILNCFMTQNPGLKRFVSQIWIYLLHSLNFFPTCPPRTCVTAKWSLPVYLPVGIPCQMINHNLLYYAYCTLLDSQVVSPARTWKDPFMLITSYGEAYKIYHHLCWKAQRSFNEVLWFGLCNNSRRK